MQNLNKEQLIRYSRNIRVKGIGVEGQGKLLSSSVCVVGCGALGSIAAAYLCGAGVGRLTVVDYDTVDISNLQRQLTFTEADTGRGKAAALADRLRKINADVEVNDVSTFMTRENAEQILRGHDFVIDGSDNPDTKYLIDDVCFRLGLPYSVAGVLSFDAQVMTYIPGHARYSDIFATSAGAGYTPCSIGGVLGPHTGIVGSIQALEAIKYITGAGELITDSVLVINTAEMSFTRIRL